MAMGLLNKSDLNKGTKQLTQVMNNVIAPVVGGVSGFLTPDFIGINGLVSEVLESTGVLEMLPVVGSLDIASFITAAVYAGIAVIVSRVTFGGMFIKSIFIALTWYFGAAALRNAINGLVGGISAVRGVTA